MYFVFFNITPVSTSYRLMFISYYLIVIARESKYYPKRLLLKITVKTPDIIQRNFHIRENGFKPDIFEISAQLD